MTYGGTRVPWLRRKLPRSQPRVSQGRPQPALPSTFVEGMPADSISPLLDRRVIGRGTQNLQTRDPM